MGVPLCSVKSCSNIFTIVVALMSSFVGSLSTKLIPLSSASHAISLAMILLQVTKLSSSFRVSGVGWSNYTPSKESSYCVGVFTSSNDFSRLDRLRAIRTNKHANIKALIERRDLLFNFLQMRPLVCYLGSGDLILPRWNRISGICLW